MDRRDLKLSGVAIAALGADARSAEWAGAIGGTREVPIESVSRKAAPVEIPVFTRGGWKTTPPLPIVRV